MGLNIYLITEQNLLSAKKKLKFCYPKTYTHIKNGTPFPAVTQHHIYNKLSIHGINALQTAKFIYQEIKVYSHTQFADLLKLNKTFYNHDTRNSNNIHTLHANSSKQQNTLIHRGIKIWNNLQPDIQNSANTQLFTKRYKQFLLTQ